MIIGLENYSSRGYTIRSFAISVREFHTGYVHIAFYDKKLCFYTHQRYVQSEGLYNALCLFKKSNMKLCKSLLQRFLLAFLKRQSAFHGPLELKNHGLV